MSVVHICWYQSQGHLPRSRSNGHFKGSSVSQFYTSCSFNIERQADMMGFTFEKVPEVRENSGKKPSLFSQIVSSNLSEINIICKLFMAIA